MYFMAVKKSRKRSGFLFFFSLILCSNDRAFTELKGIQRCKLGIRKGYHLSLKLYERGLAFSVKNGIKSMMPSV